MTSLLAWGSAILILLLCCIWPLRLICANYKLKKSHSLGKLNHILRKAHCPLGFASIAAVYLHCRVAFHTTGQRSLLGAFLLVVLIALALTGMLRRVIPKHWMRFHQILTVLLVIGTLFHSFIEFLFF